MKRKSDILLITSMLVVCCIGSILDILASLGDSNRTQYNGTEFNMVRGLYEIEQVGFDDQKNEWKEGVKSNYRLSMPLTKMESRIVFWLFCTLCSQHHGQLFFDAVFCICTDAVVRFQNIYEIICVFLWCWKLSPSLCSFPYAVIEKKFHWLRKNIGLDLLQKADSYSGGL